MLIPIIYESITTFFRIKKLRADLQRLSGKFEYNVAIMQTMRQNYVLAISMLEHEVDDVISSLKKRVAKIARAEAGLVSLSIFSICLLVTLLNVDVQDISFFIFFPSIIFTITLCEWMGYYMLVEDENLYYKLGERMYASTMQKLHKVHDFAGKVEKLCAMLAQIRKDAGQKEIDFEGCCRAYLPATFEMHINAITQQLSAMIVFIEHGPTWQTDPVCLRLHDQLQENGENITDVAREIGLQINDFLDELDKFRQNPFVNASDIAGIVTGLNIVLSVRSKVTVPTQATQDSPALAS